MKISTRIILPLVAAAAISATSCKQIEAEQTLDTYSETVTYAYDTTTGIGVASDLATVVVKGDISTSTYILEINNIQLTEGLPLESATLSNLIQYYKEGEGSTEESPIPLYYAFKQEAQTRWSGILDVNNMTFGWLSSNYWLAFDSQGRYNVWSIPARQVLYGNKNLIKGPLGQATENAINPRYDVYVDVHASTVTFKGSGVVYPQTIYDTSKTLRFRTMEWQKLPVEFSEEGYSVNIAEFIPVIEGTPSQEWTIRNFTASMGKNYETPKTVEFDFCRNADGRVLHITTEFAMTLDNI